MTEEERKILSEFETKIAVQYDLDPEFVRFIDEHFWELVAKEDL